MNYVTFGVITISDTCFKDCSKDRSGPRLTALIRETFKNCNVISSIIPDDKELIEEKLHMMVRGHDPEVAAIITTGGTGFAPRDCTPEATKAVIEKECPQLAMAIAMESLQKSKFAILSRGVCGIAGNTLILNFPGSEKAVTECFNIVRELLPHALHLIKNDLPLVRRTHDEIQVGDGPNIVTHSCPHKVKGDGAGDRNSIYPMIPITEALNIMYKSIRIRSIPLHSWESPVHIPPFRASIKDGYALMSKSLPGAKKVLGCISAGDPIITAPLEEDECYKINTGAAVPDFADCVVQVEDTTLLRKDKNDREDLVDIHFIPNPHHDIRAIGSDLKKGAPLFPMPDCSQVIVKSILASVGTKLGSYKPKIAIVSTGNELMKPEEEMEQTKIFDSNTTMLEELLKYFGFESLCKYKVGDDFAALRKTFQDLYRAMDFVICTGGVSMGDKDYIKPVLINLGFQIDFGRVNIKPGKPMTYATFGEKYFFGLPGNPVSAFVTFHMFVLPALRYASGFERDKCELAKIKVTLQNDSIPLDPRPEFVRATVTSINGQFYAYVNGNQMSSRLQSIVGADCLVHFPERTTERTCALVGDVFDASVLRYDFISKYE